MVAGRSYAQGTTLCDDFHFGSTDFAEVKAQHEGSLLLLTSGDATGTGFLIDKNRGLFLTAEHVVLATLNDHGHTPIYGQVAGTQNQKIKLSIVSTDHDRDAALLQADDPAAFAAAYPFELSFERVAPATQVAFAGMAFADPRSGAQATLSTPSAADYNRQTAQMAFRTQVNDGDSGAPVFTSQGTVVGVVINKQTASQAVATPIMEISELLINQATATPVRDFVNLFTRQTNPTDLRAKLANELKVRPPPVSISNLDFAAGIRMIVTHSEPNVVESQFVQCPLYQAAADRGLGNAAFEIARWGLRAASADLPPAERKAQLANDTFELAVESQKELNLELARLLFEDAATNLRQMIEASPTGYMVVAGLVSDTPGNFQDRQQAFTHVYQNMGVKHQPSQTFIAFTGIQDTGKDEAFSLLLRDYSFALKSAGDLSIHPHKQQTDWIAAAAALGILTSDLPSQQVRLYKTLGDAFVQKRRPEIAAESYAQAWKMGSFDQSTLQSYGFAKWQVTGTRETRLDVLERQINSEPSLSNSELKSTVLGATNAKEETKTQGATDPKTTK